MYEYHKGNSPLLISVPHCGTRLPETLAQSMTPQAHQLSDTDWHVDRLYRFAQAEGASMLSATVSRYVIDLNRPPDDAALYEGIGGTGLCPLETFDGAPLYLKTQGPDQAARLQKYWQPYHDKLASSLRSIVEDCGFAVLLDAHSIRSHVPSLFKGRLPALNLGCNNGASCAASLRATASAALTTEDFSLVVDGRFRGGYITRHYANPDDGVHALQLELSQRTYMNEDPPFNFEPQRAQQLTPVLKQLVANLLAFSP